MMMVVDLKMKIKKLISNRRLFYGFMCILLIGVILIIINVLELWRIHDTKVTIVKSCGSDAGRHHPGTVWIAGKLSSNKHPGFLQEVHNVFHSLGYALGDNQSDWDVLWCNYYPFNKGIDFSHLKPHTKVSHFPGIGFISNKDDLASTGFNFTPKAFRLPSQQLHFQTYVKENPSMMWVQKGSKHRGVVVRKASEVTLNQPGLFVQQFISNPFLIDGKKFDIGIYAVITSINPLRIYTIDGDALIRFCPKDYHPFDASDRDKYVVHDDYLPMWKMPAFQKIYNDLGCTFKEAFEVYMQRQGANMKRLWADMKAAIVEICLHKEQRLVELTSKLFDSSKYFFDMVRVDFMLDENFNFYVMEVNMSPNLSPDHFPPNQELYQFVIYNTLSLVGIATKVTDTTHSKFVSTRNIQVFLDACDRCGDDCQSQECEVCDFCMMDDQRDVVRRAYLEHVNRETCGRIFPTQMTQQEALNWTTSPKFKDLNKLTPANRFMTKWFIGKCQQDLKWCT